MTEDTLKYRDTHQVLKYRDRKLASLYPEWTSTDPRFLSLALCGEVGELANKIKKHWRRDRNFGPIQPDLKGEIYDELADSYVYLALLARSLGVKSDQEVELIVIDKIDKKIAEIRSTGSMT